MTKETGGSAFPALHSIDGNWVKEPMPKYTGMTLRDWFATHAPEPKEYWLNLQRQQDRHKAERSDRFQMRDEMELLAAWKFHYADAMLKARGEQ